MSLSAPNLIANSVANTASNNANSHSNSNSNHLVNNSELSWRDVSITPDSIDDNSEFSKQLHQVRQNINQPNLNVGKFLPQIKQTFNLSDPYSSKNLTEEQIANVNVEINLGTEELSDNTAQNPKIDKIAIGVFNRIKDSKNIETSELVAQTQTVSNKGYSFEIINFKEPKSIPNSPEQVKSSSELYLTNTTSDKPVTKWGMVQGKQQYLQSSDNDLIGQKHHTGLHDDQLTNTRTRSLIQDGSKSVQQPKIMQELNVVDSSTIEKNNKADKAAIVQKGSIQTSKVDSILEDSFNNKQKLGAVTNRSLNVSQEESLEADLERYLIENKKLTKDNQILSRKQEVPSNKSFEQLELPVSVPNNLLKKSQLIQQSLIQMGKIIPSSDTSAQVIEPLNTLRQSLEASSKFELSPSPIINSMATNQLESTASNSNLQRGLSLKNSFTPNLAHRIQWIYQQALSSAEILMDPPELGPLSVKLHNQNGETNIVFQVTNTATKETIEDNLGKLKELLAEQGIELGDTQIEQQQKDGEDKDASKQESLSSLVSHDENQTTAREQQQLGLLDTYV